MPGETVAGAGEIVAGAGETVAGAGEIVTVAEAEGAGPAEGEAAAGTKGVTAERMAETRGTDPPDAGASGDVHADGREEAATLAKVMVPTAGVAHAASPKSWACAPAPLMTSLPKGAGKPLTEPHCVEMRLVLLPDDDDDEEPPPPLPPPAETPHVAEPFQAVSTYCGLGCVQMAAEMKA